MQTFEKLQKKKKKQISRICINWFGETKLDHAKLSFVRRWQYRLCYAVVNRRSEGRKLETKPAVC